MRFTVHHRFEAKLDRVEQALFSVSLPAFLASHMTTIVEIHPLERREEGTCLHRRVRYVPAPILRSIGPKQIDPAWMAWIEESTYDRRTREMEFRNVPVVTRVRELLENRGVLRLVPSGNATERTIEGDLAVKVFLLGKIVESAIHQTAQKILQEEAKIFAQFLTTELPSAT